MIMHGKGEANGLGMEVMGKGAAPKQWGLLCRRGLCGVQAQVSRPLHQDLRQVLMFSVPGFFFCKLGLEIPLLRVLLVSWVPGTGPEFGNQHPSHYIMVVKVL